MVEKNIKDKKYIEESSNNLFFFTDTNHGKVIALAVKKAYNATINRQGWAVAQRIILQNDLLTNDEKVAVYKYFEI